MGVIFNPKLIILHILQLSLSLICNGNFQQYGLTPDINGQAYSFIISDHSCWYDFYDGDLAVRQLSLLTTCMVEFTTGFQFLLCQDVVLEVGKNYQLNFSVLNQQSVISSDMIVKINGIQAFTYTTINQLNSSQASFNFISNSTLNQICFYPVFSLTTPTGNVGPCLDNITLNLIYQYHNSTKTSKTSVSKFQLSQSVAEGISCLASFPIKIISPLKSVYLLADDLWLYDYSNKNYTGLIETIFSTLANIQLLKFQYLQKYLGWNQYKKHLKISDYRAYSMARFVEVENNSSVFLDSTFSFFVYTAPQNILFSLVVFFVFYLLREYRVSKFVRKFYFLKSTLAVVLFQGNLSYFTLICFLHFQHSFSFNFADKLSLTFTTIFLFTLLWFSFCFYLLINRYLRKSASYFAEFTYRQSAGFWYKTLQLSIRNILRAAVFCFLHYQYRSQLIGLSLIQVFVIIFSIALETYYQIFLQKFMYCLNLMYSFLIILLNIALLAQDDQDSTEIYLLIKQAQEIILYCLIFNIFLMTIRDFLPLNSTKQNSQQPEKKLNSKTVLEKDQQENKSKTKILTNIIMIDKVESSQWKIKNKSNKLFRTEQRNKPKITQNKKEKNDKQLEENKAKDSFFPLKSRTVKPKRQLAREDKLINYFQGR